MKNHGSHEGSVAGTVFAFTALIGMSALALNIGDSRDGLQDFIFPAKPPVELDSPASVMETPTTYVLPGSTLPVVTTEVSASQAPVAETVPEAGTQPVTMVHIGDSIGVQKFTQGGYEQLLADNGIVLTAHDEKGARPIVWAPCDDDPASEKCEGPAWRWDTSAGIFIGAGDAIRSLGRMSAQVATADIVELDMGQNTLQADLARDTERMLREAWSLSNVDERPAVIVMADMAHSNVSYVGPAAERNAIITGVVNSLRSEGMDIRILTVSLSGYELDSGGIHPTAQGAQQLAQYEASQIARIASEIIATNQ